MGTLSVIKGETTLEVIGDFGRKLLSETAREKTYSLDLEEKPRVLGTISNGKPITLEGVAERGHSVHIPGLAVSRYRARVALVGKHFSEEEVGFDEISIRATDLNAWTRVFGFSISMGFEQLKGKEGHALSSAEIRYDAPDEIRIPLARGEEIFIRFTAPSKGLGSGTDHVELTQEAALHLRFAKKADLAAVLKRVSQLRNFLSLAVGRPVSILSVTGFQDTYLRGETTFPRPIELYWEIPHNPEPPEKSRHFSEMFFTLDDTKPDMSTVMRRWFRRQPHLEPVFNLFFGTLYNPGLYLEVKFLAYAQAIETYDYRRRRKPGRMTLAERMRDVLARCRTVSKRIVGDQQADIDEFIKTFKDSRNYYTHYSPKLEARAAKGPALLLLCIQLQAIIEMSLLRELGFTSQAIDEMLERGKRFAQIGHFRSMAQSKANGGDED